MYSPRQLIEGLEVKAAMSAPIYSQQPIIRDQSAVDQLKGYFIANSTELLIVGAILVGVAGIGYAIYQKNKPKPEYFFTEDAKKKRVLFPPNEDGKWK